MNSLFRICICLFYMFYVYLCDALSFNPLDVFRDPEAVTDGMERMRMIYYEGSPENGIRIYNYTLSRSNLLMNHINLSKPFVLYIHGYEEHPSNESVQTVVSAYLQRGSDNIVILDWSAFSFGNYVTVALRVKDISKHTGKALENLMVAGLAIDTLHVIGHSLGAQVAGFIGRYLDFMIPRITGLDPANPLFYLSIMEHIDGKSGAQVDIIHTDGGIYGAYSSTGTVDFFANGGSRPQPGCQLFGLPLTPTSLCSHWRSWRIYAESVINETAFPSVKCKSYSTFLQGACGRSENTYAGYPAPRDISGNYYFMTNDKSPFGKGMAGIVN